MHLIFERSKGRFKSNCNILALAWMPYYNEIKFRQTLFDYHQRQLINLTNSIPANSSLVGDANRNGLLARSHNARLQNGGSRAAAAAPAQDNEPSSGGQNGDQRNNQPVNSSPTNQFLNSRIAELHQRYVYLRDVRLDRGTTPTENNENTKTKSGLGITSELDSKYGRMPDFGWLVVGNVGRIVGVTLTSTVPPFQEPKQLPPSSGINKNQDEDLMLFHESNPNCNKNGQHSCNIKPVQSLSEYDQLRPDRGSVRSNYNLRGHLDEIILVKWNELYQKLATIDSKGNVLIWCKINEKFTIQTPFYNRTKSVADFKWSNDGKTALICYTDSFILVGSSSGQRHWHSMLNLDDYHITCASWTPNDEQLLLGVSNGNVVVIDLPHSELTELVVNQTNIRAMCWSSSEMSLKHISKLSVSPSNDNYESSRRNSNRRNSTIVNHRRLSRDCSVFSRYRFCSQGPNNINNGSRRSESHHANENLSERIITFRSQGAERTEIDCEQRNILAIDFANNTIRLYDGGLDDPDPRTIQVNMESYIMHWSSDGKVLAVAGFNIHTTAPSVGCLRCRYLNAIKFYNQQGQLTYDYTMRYTRYPITAFTWAHDDQRLFLATGPRLHCAKVFFGIAPLSLLSISCFQRYTKLPDKSDILESILQNHYSLNVFSWQSNNCPIDILKESKTKAPHCLSLLSSSSSDNNNIKLSPLGNHDGSESATRSNICNNSNVYQYQLPSKLQTRIDELFTQTIRQPYDEHWTLNDIIWHVPKNEKRYYCTLVCYTSDRDISSKGYQYRTDLVDRISDNHAGDQNKIFVLYVEFQGSLIPILRARRVGFLKPEFVIFDPEDSQLRAIRQRKVSDISQQLSLNTFIQRRFDLNQQRLADPSPSTSSAIPTYYYNEGFSGNCSELHLELDPRASSSSIGRQSLSDAEHYYNFECDTVNRQQQDRLADLISGRSHHQEPIALPIGAHPYLLYLMAMSSAGVTSFSGRQHQANGPLHNKLPISASAKRAIDRYKLRNAGLTSTLSESNELVRIKSNIWGTKFKLINVGNRMIKQRSVLGSVVYKASILHLQPRQILLNVKDMSNYCCLCSKHHHTRLAHNKLGSSLINGGHSGRSNGYDNNKTSLLDMPNIEPPLITPQKSSGSSSNSGGGRKLRPNKSDTCKQQELDGGKVVVSVGDIIRIAPKLDRNQQYRFAGHLIVDDQKPSTSKSSGHKRSMKNNVDADWSRLRSHGLTMIKADIDTDRNQLRSQGFVYYPDKEPSAYRCPSSETHSKAKNNFFSDNQVESPSTSSKDSSTYQQPSSSPSNNNTLNNQQQQPDDILTLSLGQGDQVKVEMSSLRFMKDQGGIDQVDQKRCNYATGGPESTRGPNANIDEFLATNKTLKSIQTITKMIVDLSSKAEDISGEDRSQIDADLLSPSKLVKLSDESKASPSCASKYVPPDTPVHRPRRIASKFSGETVASLHRNAQFGTQSATTTPLKYSNAFEPRKHRRRGLDKSSEMPTVANNLVPAPPPSVPIHRRLSSSAKRFIDGSLRSLYGPTASDVEPEESEPLVSERSSSMMRRNSTSSKKTSSRLWIGQSQPCTPVRSLSNSSKNNNSVKQSTDLSSLRSQLIHKLRGRSAEDSRSNLKPACSANSTDQLDRYGGEVRKSRWRNKSLLNSSSSDYGSSSSDSSSDSESEGEDSTNSSSTDSELNRNGTNISKKLSNSKFRFSTSVKDLRDFKFGQDAKDEQKQRQKQIRCKLVSDRHRRHRRRKSICSNSSCCCAKEFKLNNRPPVWNEQSQVYQLDFGGRVTQESAKNLQIDFEGNLALQFGRIDRYTYTLDYKYPFNAVQAMAIALASLTQRLK